MGNDYILQMLSKTGKLKTTYQSRYIAHNTLVTRRLSVFPQQVTLSLGEYGFHLAMQGVFPGNQANATEESTSSILV